MACTPASLIGKYTITKVNGKAAPAGVHISFSAGEKPNTVQFHTKVANIINGTLTLEGCTLKGTAFATMMMGPPDLMEVERVLSAGAFEGMTASVSDSAVTLTAGSETLVLEKKH